MLSSPFNRLQQQHNENLIKQQLVQEINKIKKRNMLIHQSNFIKMQQYKKSLEEKDKKPLEENKKQQPLEEQPKNRKTFCFIDAKNTTKINVAQEQKQHLEQPKNKKGFAFI